MARSKKQKTPKLGYASKNAIGENNQVRTPSNFPTNNQHQISWQIGSFDRAGPWGDCSLKEISLLQLIEEKISPLESMSWNEILLPAGGRSQGTNNHMVKVSGLSKRAIDRLRAIQLDDLDELFSLRLQGKQRIYGIRRGSHLKILWLDLAHGSTDDCVYPTKKR